MLTVPLCGIIYSYNFMTILMKKTFLNLNYLIFLLIIKSLVKTTRSFNSVNLLHTPYT